MGIVTGLVLFLVIWFLTLLIILPIRLETQGDRGEIVPGTHIGSPADPQMKKRFLITTAITFVIWAIAATVILNGWITARDLDFWGIMD
ncbi:MAG: DUF1467 family protein [Planktomarina sp.]